MRAALSPPPPPLCHPPPRACPACADALHVTGGGGGRPCLTGPAVLTAARDSGKWPWRRRLSPPRARSPRTSALKEGLESHAIAEGLDDVGASSEEAAFAEFERATSQGNLVPIFERIFSDQLTPVTAYRCLVREDDREAPSFLFESVVNGTQQGRYSFVGARPCLEVVARGRLVTVINHEAGTRDITEEEDPLAVPMRLGAAWQAAPMEGLPGVFTGGWVGYCGYDTVRYVYPRKLTWEAAPPDLEQLPDMHLALYRDTVVFDLATKLAYCVVWLDMSEYSSTRAAFAAGRARLARQVQRLAGGNTPHLPAGKARLALMGRPSAWPPSNMSKEAYLDAVASAKEHILAGDIFQLVLSQRFQRRTFADPFEIYRALRVVNPSPYMIYLQARGSILVASSPEILCRVGEDRVVTNRPLAGTRRRGDTPEADEALEAELLGDAKERAEHVMLVDLGRNDVGKACPAIIPAIGKMVAEAGSVSVDRLMEVERYSHVMHISSTVTGRLLPGLTAWDALRAALPAGTVSGAPKVRAMQLIDELEAAKRGPYGGGVGHVSFTGGLDMALALRTMVVPTAPGDGLYDYDAPTGAPRREWTVNLQAGAGLVADSVPEAEYEECVNKAAALGRAIDLAEEAFLE